MELLEMVLLAVFVWLLVKLSGIKNALDRLGKRIDVLADELKTMAWRHGDQPGEAAPEDVKSSARQSPPGWGMDGVRTPSENPVSGTPPSSEYRLGWNAAEAPVAAKAETAPVEEPSVIVPTALSDGAFADEGVVIEAVEPDIEDVAAVATDAGTAEAEPAVTAPDAACESPAGGEDEEEESAVAPVEAAAMSIRPVTLEVDEEIRKAAAPAADKASPVDGLIRTLINFFKAGNIWVSGGVIMVLLGFGFLLSFMSERGILSVEMRIAMAALGGMVMVGIGLFLRLKKPVYAMVMQGGGIGVIYLAVFAAAKLTTLLSPPLALGLMCLLMVPAVGLALLQNAQVLAVFGFLGGFAAPILLSSGSGEYVVLFSYYTLLDLALLAITRFKLWRWLNLLGAGCSFGVMGVWGFLSYQPGMFVTVEPFLLGFTAIFLLITLASVQKREFSFSNPPDLSLAIGVPLAAVAFQWQLAQELAHGLSLSALCFGAFFILLAAIIWKFWKKEGRRLAEVYLASGALLVNLAAPLEFSGAVTSGIWAAEGALTFFFGCRYASRKVRRAGLGLQCAAMVSFLFDPALWGDVDKHVLLESLLLALAFIASGYWQKRLVEKDEASGADYRRDAGFERFFDEGVRQIIPLGSSLAGVLVFTGMFWYFAGFALEFIYFSENPGLYFFISASVSSLVFSIAARFLNFRELYPAFLVPAFYSLVRLVAPIYYGQTELWYEYVTPVESLNAVFTHQYFAGLELASWLLFALSAAVFFRLSGARLMDRARNAIMCVVVLELLFMCTCSLRSLAFDSLKLGPSWVSFCGLLPAFAYICAMIAFTHMAGKKRLAENLAPALFKIVPAVLFCFLGGWFLLGMFDPGHPAPLSVYIPLFNPLELQQAFCVALFVAWRQRLERVWPSPSGAVYSRLAVGVTLLAFAWLHSIIIRTTHFYAGVPFDLDVWDEDLFQVLLTALWGLCGTAAIVFGHKKEMRPVWIAGVSLIILDTIKLFLKDLSDKSTMMHIVSFFIVGGVFLLIGLLAPLPPAVRKKDAGAEPAPEQSEL